MNPNTKDTIQNEIIKGKKEDEKDGINISILGKKRKNHFDSEEFEIQNDKKEEIFCECCKCSLDKKKIPSQNLDVNENINNISKNID